MALAEKGDTWPVRSNWLSFIGHPCQRHIFYKRTHWQHATKPDPILQRIFWLGRNLEKIIGDRVRKCAEPRGWEVLKLPGRANHFAFDPMCSGRIDFVLQTNGKSLPVVLEIKSVSEYVFDHVNSVEDMLNRPEPWWRGYPYQLWGYEKGASEAGWTEKDGMWALMAKATGRIKFIAGPYDDILMGKCLSRLHDNEHRVKEWAASKLAAAIPDRIDYEDAVCGKCDFLSLCKPAMQSMTELDFIDSDEIKRDLARVLELAPTVKEHDKISKKLKELARLACPQGKKELLVEGAGIIKVAHFLRTSYSVPKDIRDKYAEKSDTCRVTFAGL